MRRVAYLTLLMLLASVVRADAEPLPLRIRLNDGTFEVSGFSPAAAKRLADKDFAAQLADVFSVRVVGKADLPPLLGEYSIKDCTLRLKPRYPDPARRSLSGRGASRQGSRSQGRDVHRGRADVPAAQTEDGADRRGTHLSVARGAAGEPAAFYFYFSAPMSRGDVYKYIRLLDAAGKPVEAPFLELEQELWDESGQRFTLLIDPGRIKRGLKPREEVGPALEQGKSYTLEISREWNDANGKPLKETYRKKFRVAAPDETQPDPKTWKLQVPAAGKSEPLIVTFPKPLDRAMLGRVLSVTDDRGEKIEGTIAVTDEETRWRFTPKGPWRAGTYNLVVDTALEDPAGNSIARPFEVDVFRPISSRVKTETVKVSFTVK